MLSQKQQQKLLQKLSPQQIQLMKLYQIPTFALEERIKEELEENPALEEAGANDNDYDESGEETTIEKDENITENNDDEFTIDDYLQDDEIPDYKLYSNNRSKDQEDKTAPVSVKSNYAEYLKEQLHLRKLTPKQMVIGEHIIGNIDESGYLTREPDAIMDDLAFLQNVMVNIDEVKEVLAIIQDFEPYGTGAQNLQECLYIQLQQNRKTDKAVEVAKEVIKNCYPEFIKKHYDKIQQKLHIEEDDLKNALQEILKLNPKPGNAFSDNDKANEYVIPDFTIQVNDGELELYLNSKNAPTLHLSSQYRDMLKAYSSAKNKTTQQKNTIKFVKQKLDSAKWFIDAIKQRQHTLFSVMKSIMDHQKDYFLSGDEKDLKPLILKNIAEEVGMDISTISRVTSNKYVQTPYGTFLLKTFFSESIETDDGKQVSTKEVKQILADAIKSEDKKTPYTDDKLSQILKEKGYKIARRTIAKYREQLNYPVARLRKEL